jgi:hypothetical protein
MREVHLCDVHCLYILRKSKQWTLWILASSWIFLSSMDYVYLLSRAISLCTYTMIWSEQALCLKSSYNMWILLWLWKFVVYVILKCVMLVWLYNNSWPHVWAKKIFVSKSEYVTINIKKKYYKPCVPLFHIMLDHNVEVLLELKKVLQQTISMIRKGWVTHIAREMT